MPEGRKNQREKEASGVLCFDRLLPDLTNPPLAEVLTVASQACTAVV
jgi:hypothetical protein